MNRKREQTTGKEPPRDDQDTEHPTRPLGEEQLRRVAGGLRMPADDGGE
ncbi:MAG TPA: hypothetical protein VMV46_02305 [Thermoanaerobaculia bacterium]|nr:hypothetical protein [Thermoanaerobaculia bacterium]